MILRREIDGQRVNFVVGDDACLEGADPETPAQRQSALRSHTPTPVSSATLYSRVGDLVAAIRRMPWQHIVFLRAAPIVIVTAFPDGNARATGGWYPPRRPGNPLADRWFTELSQRNTHVPAATFDTVPYVNGIIGLCTLALLENPASLPGAAQPWQFSLMHEIGHCVDFHGDPSHAMRGLESPGNPDHRHGNQAYQGQRYGGAYNPLEFRAETYSRLILTPQRMCRRGDAVPPCVTRNHADCNERLQRDLALSAAFLVRGVDMARYLPLAARPASPATEGGSAGRSAPSASVVNPTPHAGARQSRPAGTGPET